jgi:hypothetical protein
MEERIIQEAHGQEPHGETDLIQISSANSFGTPRRPEPLGFWRADKRLACSRHYVAGVQQQQAV